MSQTLFRGQRRLVDTETGEIIETQVVERAIDGGDVGFHKVWLGHILELVEEVGNAKMTILVWLLKQADSKNQVLASFADISKATGTGISTVHRLMGALVRADVITRAHRYGPWRLNPQVIFKGSHQSRMNVLIKYRDERQADMFDAPPATADAVPTPAPVVQLPKRRKAA